MHIAVALDGAGWHPAAWREPDARPTDLLTAGYWTDLVREAESAHLDFVTFEDALALQSGADDHDGRTDQVRGRLDAVLIAARVAPVTSAVGLVPTATVTHTEPFHIAKAIATLDFVGPGRAGWRAQVSGRAVEARHFGRRDIPDILYRDLTSDAARALLTELFAEAGDHIEVVRRLWDSWEDGAEIRDAATGRFLDRDRLHYIDFEGRFFSVRGPSITPRPPQGQPLVVALAHHRLPYRLAAVHADVVFVTPESTVDAQGVVAEVREEEAAVERDAPLHVFADLVVFLDEDAGRARDRKARLDERAGAPFTSDAEVFVGTPAELADVLVAGRERGLTGYRLRPGALPHDLNAITRALVPELRARGAFRSGYEPGTLRERLGLRLPANRYAPTGGQS